MDVEGITTDTRPNWGSEPGRAPTVQDGETVIFSEYGRILHNIDYRSHWFMVVRSKVGLSYSLLVKHGGGEERIQEWEIGRATKFLEKLDSDNRYLALHALHALYRMGHTHGSTIATETYRRAFIEGRLKKRKMPRRDAVKVWIEEKTL